jgi:hypothetical protein
MRDFLQGLVPAYYKVNDKIPLEMRDLLQGLVPAYYKVNDNDLLSEQFVWW